MSATDILDHKKTRMRKLADLPEDLKLFKEGVLGWRSLLGGYTKHRNHVQMEIRAVVFDKQGNPVLDENGEPVRRTKSISRNHNLRTNTGRDWQCLLMGGDVPANIGYTNTSTGVTATTLTQTGATWTTNQWAGHAVATAGTFATVLSNTASVLTFDQWYLPGSATGASTTTPGTGTFVILPGQTAALWVGITVDTTAPAVTDAAPLTSEQTTNGLGRAVATFAHTGGTATYTMSKTWTYTGSGVQTLHKVGMFNSATITTGQIMFLETVLNADAPVTANGDQAVLTWTITP